MNAKKLRFWATLLSAVMCLGLLAGCGGDTNGTGNTNDISDTGSISNVGDNGNIEDSVSVPQTTQAPGERPNDATAEPELDVDAIMEEALERLSSPWVNAGFSLDSRNLGTQQSGEVFYVEVLPGQKLSVETWLHDDLDIVEAAWEYCYDSYEFEWWNEIYSSDETIACTVSNPNGPATMIEFLKPGEVTLTLFYGDEMGYSEHSLIIECVVTDPAGKFAEMTPGRCLADLDGDGRVLAGSDGKIYISNIGNGNTMLYDSFESLLDRYGNKIKTKNFSDSEAGYGYVMNLNEYNGEIYYTCDGEIRKMNSDLSGYDTIYFDDEWNINKLFFVLGDDFYCHATGRKNMDQGCFMRLSPNGELEATIDSIIGADNFACDAGKLYFTAKTSAKPKAENSDYCINLATMTVQKLDTNYIDGMQSCTISDGIMYGLYYNSIIAIDLEAGTEIAKAETPVTYNDAGVYEGKMYLLRRLSKIDGPSSLVSYDFETETFTGLVNWDVGDYKGDIGLYFADGRLYVRATEQYHSPRYLVYDIADGNAVFWY